MSRWGEDNFDNDLSSDVLFFIVWRLVDRINRCLEYDKRDKLFCGETEVMPSVDILLTLAKAYPDILLRTFEDLPISDWKKKYLNIFETQSEVPMNNKFQAERRLIIQETFLQLETLVENYTSSS